MQIYSATKTNDFLVSDENCYQELFARYMEGEVYDLSHTEKGQLYHAFSWQEVTRDIPVQDEEFIRELQKILPEGVAFRTITVYFDNSNSHINGYAVIATRDRYEVLDLDERSSEMANTILS